AVFSFVANLKPYTFAPPHTIFSAYLLSTAYARDFGRLAGEVIKKKRILVADNGNLDRINALVEIYRARAAALDLKRQAVQKKLTRPVRPGDIAADLRTRYQRLARDVAAQSERVLTATVIRDVVAAQCQLHPDYLVAMEDFTVPVLATLNLEREF